MAIPSQQAIVELWKEYVDESKHEGTEITIEDFGLYLQYRNDVPVTLVNVTFVVDEDDERTFTTDVRVDRGAGDRTLEYKVICEQCGVDNWVVVGTDAGEYRCINCTGWL